MSSPTQAIRRLATLEEIAAGPRRGAKGAKRSSPNATEEDDDEGLTSHHHNHSNRHRRHHHIIIVIAAYIIAIISVIIAVIIVIITIKKGPKHGNDSTDSLIFPLNYSQELLELSQSLFE